MRALVVDDSRAMRSMIGNLLRDIGFEVAEACDGVDALNRIREGGEVDLALVDWNMPEMNGYEFIRAMRADSSHHKTALVMVTAETELNRVKQALSAGATEYIMKPFTRECLQAKLGILGLCPEVESPNVHRSSKQA
jgi:two-component system, chemotaxis family, chemotaxis protein CheY